MSQIAHEAENLMFSQYGAGAPWTWSVGNWPGPTGDRRGRPNVARAGQVLPITDAVVEAASPSAAGSNAALLVVATHSGPDGAGPLQAAQRHPDARPDRRRRGRPGDGALLGRHRRCTSRSSSRPGRCWPSPTSGAAPTT